MNKLIAVCAATAAFVASPASAAIVFTSVAGNADSYAAPAGASTVIDFNSGSVVDEAAAKGLVATTTGIAQSFSGYVFDFNGTGNDFYRPEPTDTTDYFGVARESSLTLTSAVALTGVSAFIGSLDDYNVVTFFGSAGEVLGSFTGEQIFSAGEGSERRVTFSTTGDTQIFGVSFANNSGKGSFEFDNVALTAAVPEPATWAMMLVGFGMIGAVSRYRRRHSAVTYA